MPFFICIFSYLSSIINIGDYMKKITIIGAGITGLSAGIHALEKGYHVEIYEKNNWVGGCCTGWYRQNYYIDNCMHWLTGTNQHTKLFKLWKHLNAIDETSNLYQGEYFYKSILNESSIALYFDLEKTRKEMLKLSIEDKKEINKFINTVKIIAESNIKHNIFFTSYLKSKGYLKAYRCYHKLNLSDLSRKFKHPLLQLLFTDYLPSNYSALALICAYATFASGNGKVYAGGSKEFAENIATQFIRLGGVIHFKQELTKINIIDNEIDTIEFNNNNKLIKIDNLIYTADPYYLFNKLISSKYMPLELTKRFSDIDNFPPVSSYHAAYLVDKSSINFNDSIIINIPSTKIGFHNISRLLLKEYSFLTPKQNKTVIQVFIPQDIKDYEEWNNLYKNKDEYNDYKKDLSNKLKNEIINAFPNLSNIELLDSWTPITYNNYYNSYYGSYMGFTYTKNGNLSNITSKIKGVKNLLLATYWQRICGGLPIGAKLGKDVVSYI